MTSRRGRLPLGLGFAAVCLLAACTQPTGPVLGEWEGRQPGRGPSFPKLVDLVLDGTPDAQSGTYHIATTQMDPDVVTGNGEQRWTGTWVRSERTANGQPVKVIMLKDHLPDDIGAYALEADGALHILDPNGLPDTTRAGQLYTLRPVTPRHAQ